MHKILSSGGSPFTRAIQRTLDFSWLTGVTLSTWQNNLDMRHFSDKYYCLLVMQPGTLRYWLEKLSTIWILDSRSLSLKSEGHSPQSNSSRKCMSLTGRTLLLRGAIVSGSTISNCTADHCPHEQWFSIWLWPWHWSWTGTRLWQCSARCLCNKKNHCQ